MLRSSPLKFHVPQGLDLSYLPPEQRDFAHYLTSLIHWKTITWQADHNGWVHLKHEYLTKIIPRNAWLKLRRQLQSHSVIQCDERFIPGVKAYGYRLAEPYCTTTQPVACHCTKLARKIRSMTQQGNLLSVHRHLKKHLAMVDFDLKLARRIIPTTLPDDGSSLTADEYHGILQEICSRFSEGWFICDTVGRIHTPITSLPRELRPCLSVNGQPLVGLDIANSQPLLGGIVAALFFRSRMQKSRLLSWTPTSSENPYCYRRLGSYALATAEGLGSYALATAEGGEGGGNPNPTPSNTTARPQLSTDLTAGYNVAQLLHLPSDLRNYVDLCQSGQIYEFLMRPGEDRQLFKKRFFADVFFGPDHYRGSVKDRFEDEFPNMAQMLSSMKRRSPWLAPCLMQNVESTAFIYGVCRRIMRECPNLSLLTIHDSILTTPDAVDYARAVILDEFSKLGIRPTIHEEHHGLPSSPGGSP